MNKEKSKDKCHPPKSGSLEWGGSWLGYNDSREKSNKKFSDKQRSIHNINSTKLKNILINLIAKQKRIASTELEIKINSIDEDFIEIEILEPYHQYKGIKTETLFSKVGVKK